MLSGNGTIDYDVEAHTLDAHKTSAAQRDGSSPATIPAHPLENRRHCSLASGTLTTTFNHETIICFRYCFACNGSSLCQGGRCNDDCYYFGRGDCCSKGTPSAVEVAAAETTVSFEAYNTHTSVTPTVITFEMSVQRAGANSGQFTFLVNGESVTAHTSFETTWVYPGTTVALSFPARRTAFAFTGEATAEVTISPEHTHLTIDGVETFVNLPGLTTTIGVSEATNVIVDLPAVTTSLELSAETYAFTAITDAQTVSGGNYYCGTFTGQTLENGKNGSPCVMGTTFTVTLPASADNLYLHADGITTPISLPGITTTFVPEQTITIVKDGSTEISVISAVVNSYVTTTFDYWK